MAWPWSRKRKHFDSPPKPLDQMWLDMLGRTSNAPVGRTDALSVPAVLRGRNMLCSIATLPLEQIGPDNTVADSALLRQLDPDVPNVVTLSQTLEDLVFDSISWWLITAQDFSGFPTSVRHIDAATVSLHPPVTGQNPAPLPSGTDPRGAVVWIDGKPVDASRVIRFDSPNPPVLKVAGRPIRRAILLDRTAATYADSGGRPLDYFSPADDADPVDDTEITEMLNTWKAARKAHATAYIPAALKYQTVDSPSPQQLQLAELSKQASLDIANALGIDPEDLGISTTSRTYSNDVDRRRNKLNEVLAPYMKSLTDRLSMGDVTRRGYVVRFNTTEYLLPNPTDRWSNYSTAKGMGAMTVDEIRQAEGLPPLPADAEPEPSSEVDSGPPDTLSQVEADRPASMTFDGPDLTFADLPLTSFSVDREARTIEGLALPYNQVGSKGGMKFRFQKGSLQFADPGRVKLVFPNHPGDPGSTSTAIGKAVKLADTGKGFLARFKVARGPEGDRALSLAEDGVYDGLSVGVDFDMATDTTLDPRDRSVMLVNRADLRHVALTDAPVFDDARVTSVAASRTQGGPVADTETEQDAPEITPESPAAPTPQTFSAEQVRAMLAEVGHAPAGAPPVAPDERQIVDPTRSLNLSVTREAVPYRFDRGGNFVPGQPHVFSADLHEMARHGDEAGTMTDAGKRVMGLLHATFADVDTTDINELTPNIQRPDMYVDQQDYRYPIWAAISKGAPPNGVQPFTFPKFSSASGLVGDHTEGTEPSSGTFVTTSQTVTPTAISGKASITREVWDMGGNPAVSTLIFNQMVRGWREGLESAAATFLNTLTAATDINLGVAVTDEALAAAWDIAVADLNFIRGYDLSTFVIEQMLYRAFVDATAADGRKIYPQIGPANATGQSARRFTQLDLAGVTGLPSWALTATPGAANNSWLFDPMFVHGWATTPQRLEFPGTASAGTYAPVAMVDLAIWGYKALANSDIGAVRQVIYDNA